MGGDPLSNIASPPRLEETERNIMYFIYDTKTKVNRGFADTKEEAHKLLIQEGGLSILADDTIVEKSDYEMAELVDES